MQQNQNKKKVSLLWHLLAISIVFIWGTTFVNTKILFNAGIKPHEIFVIRFFIAYVFIWFIAPKRLWCNSLKDELCMVLLGLTGGSIYFLTENYAVGISYVNNVSFLVCTAPLVTMLLGFVFTKSVKPGWKLITGSAIALTGVALVIFNGRFVLHLNPLGDFLALAAATSWAVYSLLMKKVATGYSATFITRKVFFYGMITMLPVFFFEPWTCSWQLLLQPKIWTNLLFLGFVASFLCFLLWTIAIERLGTMQASNYIYLSPVSTIVVSSIFLNEPMTLIAYLGSALILAGVVLANKGEHT